MKKISENLRNIISEKKWNYAITFLIVLNTAVIGIETYPQLMLNYGHILKFIDNKILLLFILEITLRIYAYRFSFFKDPWSIFDLFVVTIALIPTQNAFSALRAARALRALRLISIFPKLRGVIEGLVMAIPGIFAIGAVMLIIITVFGLMASKLYGGIYPELFGNLHLSIFTLFQIMTLEGWPDIVRKIMAQKPFAWLFFISYILIATFSVLNLFIAVIVDAMQRNNNYDKKDELQKIDLINKKLDQLLQDKNIAIK